MTEGSGSDYHLIIEMNWRRTVVAALLVCVISGLVSADDPVVAAVPNIRATEVSQAVVATCRSYVETALFKTQAFSVLSYTDVEQVLSAQEFSISDCTDEECAVQIGKLLAAEQIVVGELAAVEGQMVLSIRLVDVSSGRSLQAETVQVASVDELQDKAFEATYRLAGLRYVPGSDVLIKETGTVYASSPSGLVLEVFLDGKLWGKTPALLEDIPYGTHVVEAKSGAYYFKKEVSLRTKEILEVVADVETLRAACF